MRDTETHNRVKFDQSMFDTLGRNITLKVYSHQLNNNFTEKEQNIPPNPCLCIVSANQYADNAATQVKEIIHTIPHDLDHMYYSPFSPRWCFTFDGCTTNKGATRVFYDRIDEELIL